MEQTDIKNSAIVETIEYVGDSAYKALYRRIKKRIDRLVDALPSQIKEWATSTFVKPADVAALVDGYRVTVTENGALGSTLKSYVFSQQGEIIATINIPKDLVVSSGSVVVGNWVDGVFTENVSGTGKAVKLVIANQLDPIYINVQDLVDVYTAAKGATEIQIAISDTNEISATLVKSVRDKIDNAIPKVSGATGKVAQFKSDGSLESSSFEIKKSVPADAVFTDTIIDNEPGEGIDVSGSHGKKISLSVGTMSILADAVSDHEKLAGIEAGAQKNNPNTVVDAGYVHTDNNYTTEEKNNLKAVIAEKDALIQDMMQAILLERKGYNAVPLVCGQPMILIGYGTPQDDVVPFNWRQFDPETGEGYNWNGLPSANGQIYIDAYNGDNQTSTAKIYVAVSLYNAGDLVWRQC